MCRILLLQLDGGIPNIAIARISAHHRELGDEVVFHHNPPRKQLNWRLRHLEAWVKERPFDVVYASTIFSYTRPVAERLLELRPDAVVGGSGWSLTDTLEAHGIVTRTLDYSLWPGYRHSIGFSQRGCRLSCKFCIVPAKEGKVREEQTIMDIWRGEPWPRNILLLDNDFFGAPRWRERIAEIRDGGFQVSFNQGINCRMLTDETAAAIASIKFRDDSFQRRRIYTAWDSLKDENRVFAGLEALSRAGIRPYAVMVYTLTGYWHGPQLHEEDFHRVRRLIDLGYLPFPMPFARTRELQGFTRWVIGGYCKHGISWEQWVQARYQPERLPNYKPKR